MPFTRTVTMLALAREALERFDKGGFGASLQRLSLSERCRRDLTSMPDRARSTTTGFMSFAKRTFDIDQYADGTVVSVDFRRLPLAPRRRLAKSAAGVKVDEILRRVHVPVGAFR